MTKNFLKQSFFVRFRAIYRAVSKSLTSLYNFSVAASGLISAGEKALPKTIFSPPFLSYSPVIANGTITAPPLWAMATAPGLNGNKSASVLLRVPSGKTPTAPPLYRIYIALLTAAASKPSRFTGMHPAHLKSGASAPSKYSRLAI